MRLTAAVSTLLSETPTVTQGSPLVRFFGLMPARRRRLCGRPTPPKSHCSSPNMPSNWSGPVELRHARTPWKVLVLLTGRWFLVA